MPGMMQSTVRGLEQVDRLPQEQQEVARKIFHTNETLSLLKWTPFLIAALLSELLLLPAAYVISARGPEVVVAVFVVLTFILLPLLRFLLKRFIFDAILQKYVIKIVDLSKSNEPVSRDAFYNLRRVNDSLAWNSSKYNIHNL